MRPADTWKDYELLDATDGNRLERWGETLLVRPDPQVVWKTPQQSPLWAKADAVYHRSNQGGGEWEYRRRLPEKWKISCGEGEDKLTLIVSPTGFKHTGVFPEQAVNWAWYAKKIRAAGRPIKVLNLFGYTGGATLACAAAGATVCHVDASKGIVAWGKDNAAASGLANRPIRWLVDDCAKFVAREKRRGNTYDGIIMDPPSYGRGPGGEIWKLEDCIYDLISQCEEVLSDQPLFFAVNSYTTGLSPAVMEYMLKTTLVPRFGGQTSCDEIGLPVSATGSGKSTLITHMNGLNKPTSGKIIIDGRDLWAEPEKIRDFRFLTGLVFQYPEYQLFEETCYKDIAFGPKNMGLDEAEIDARVHEAARFVGLDEALLERSPFELSGGQKRRVAVAGVMAMKPRILVLDEPAAGLDPEGRDEILSEVKDYHKKTGTTVLLVSHSMEDIAKYADKVLVMSRKKIAMYDTVEKVFARAPELLELGLSVPQVTKIFLKLREMGVDVPADVYTIPYAVKTILAAKARRDAGETLVLPRNENTQEGGAAGC